MNFLHPLFLYGLLALSIPIIVHLFNFRKAKTIYFSNTRFLQQVNETSSAKRKLKHYLVLLSRLLFLFFLVMVFAQPIIPSTDNGLKNEYVTIYVDTSKSMENLTESGKAVFDEALAYVQEIINVYPKGTKYRLITNNFTAFENSYKSAEKLEDHLTEITINGVNRSLMEVENRRNSLAKTAGSVNEDVYIISDFQKSTFGDVKNWKFDSANAYYLLPVQFEKTNNISIDSLYLATPFILDKQHVTLMADIHNFGNDVAENITLKVFIDEVLVSSTAVSLLGGETKTLTFDVSYTLKKENKARIMIDDYPVTFDDEFYFIINTINQISILEITEDEIATPVTKVYGNQNLFHTTTQPIANVDYSLITSSELVILNQISTISPSLISAIRSYVIGGGRLLIIPSEEGNTEAYRQFLSSNLLRSAEDTTLQELAKPDLNNPFFANIFEEKQVVFSMPRAKAIYKWKETGTGLLQFKLGTPFLSMHTSIGKVFIMASPLIDKFTNFHKHAIFVPIMYKIATFQSKNNIRPYYFLNESTFKTRLDTLATDLIYKIMQGNNEIIPDQRIVANDLIIEVPKHILHSGFASIQFQKEHMRWMALNMNPLESNLRQFSIDVIQSFSNQNENVTLFYTTDAKAFSKEIKARYLGQALWKYAVILALLFLLVESLIIRFMR